MLRGLDPSLPFIRHHEWYIYSMETTIDKAGRLVIPKSLREQAGLSPGTRLEINYRDGRFEIEPVVAEAEIVRDGPVWAVRIPGAPTLTLELANETLRQIRERGL